MLIQCPKCKAWTDAAPGICELCGECFDINDINLVRRNESDSPYGMRSSGPSPTVLALQKKIILIIVLSMLFTNILVVLIILFVVI